MTDATESHAAEQVRATVDSWERAASAVRVLEKYAGHAWADLNATNANRCGAAREVLDLDARGDDLEDVADGLDEAVDSLGEFGLDAWITGRRSARSDAWDIESAIVVTTTGGPHVQLEYDGREVRVIGWDWFGADRTSRTLSDDAAALVVRAFALDLMMEDA